MNLAYENKNYVSWQQSLIASIEVGIVVINADFVIEEWNQFMENHSGIDAQEACGKNLFACFDNIDSQWLKNKCQPVFELQTPVFMIWEQRQYLFPMEVARPITSPAEYMFQNISIFPIYNPQGKVDKACFLVYDVTDHAMSKVRIQSLNQELEEISRVDGLTGLYNRRYWQERFEKEYKLRFRNKQAISVLIMDIDHFKKVNDTYGHQAGDEVIKDIAEIIRLSVRETDICGRYGGEEFVILLPDTDANSAKIVAQRIRQKAESHTVIHQQVSIKVTVSLGVAEFAHDYTRPMHWLEAADEALYQAKNQGRNQVVVASR